MYVSQICRAVLSSSLCIVSTLPFAASSLANGDEPAKSEQVAQDPAGGQGGKDEGAPLSDSTVAAALLGSLSPDHMKSLGQMLEQDWKARPEWGDMAIAILKNDFMRPGTGWWQPSAKRHDWNWLRERFDRNSDGKVERDEFPSELVKAEQSFIRLDRDGDSQLTAADFDHSDPQVMNVSVMKNRMSAQLFSRLDSDSNGRVTVQELAEFFTYADAENLGFITPDDLRFAIDDPPRKPGDAEPKGESRPAGGPSSPAAALRMFLRGELGWLSAGPKIGDMAPDFDLPRHDRPERVKLSESLGKRPVVLVFGSFT